MYRTFEELLRAVASLQPGQHLLVDEFNLELIPGIGGFTSRDRVEDRLLSNVVGSGTEWGYERDSLAGTVKFFRLLEPLTDGRRTYVDPDRRQFYDQDARGFYHRNSVPS